MLVWVGAMAVPMALVVPVALLPFTLLAEGLVVALLGIPWPLNVLATSTRLTPQRVCLFVRNLLS